MDSEQYCDTTKSVTYQNSAIARLLVTGNLDNTAQLSKGASLDNEPPLDLSLAARTKSTPVSPNRKRTFDGDFSGSDVMVQCRYCSYKTSDVTGLYSHYQSHKQIPTGTGSASPRIDWIQPRTDDSRSSTPAHSPGNNTVAASDNCTLRTLLQPKAKQSGEAQSASRYLKSIVQNIIRQRMPIGGSAHSSLAPSRSSTPAYESRPSSEMSSPRRTGQDPLNQCASPGSDIQRTTESLEKASRQVASYLVHSDYSDPGSVPSSTDVSPDQDHANNANQTTTHTRPETSVPCQVKQEFSPHESSCYVMDRASENDRTSRDDSSSGDGGRTLRDDSASGDGGRRHLREPERLNITNGYGGIPSVTSRPREAPTPLYAHKQYKRVCRHVPLESVRSPPDNHVMIDRKEAVTQCSLPSVPDVARQVADSPTSDGVHSRCSHCGISFDDEVIFSIHMGCHNHRDPFICNVCGRACGNKYAFYTHIMRGHEYS